MSQEKKRIVNWWMRWEDLSWPSRDGLDRVKERAEKFAKANVTTAMIFGAHFRWDFLLYFTLLHDYIATVAEELHQYGIERKGKRWTILPPKKCAYVIVRFSR